MKKTLVVSSFILAGVFILAGCGGEKQINNQNGVDIKTNEASVQTNQNGVDIKTNEASVQTNKNGVEIETDEASVNIKDGSVEIDVPGVDIDY